MYRTEKQPRLPWQQPLRQEEQDRTPRVWAVAGLARPPFRYQLQKFISSKIHPEFLVL